jgi:hypothetical protein
LATAAALLAGCGGGDADPEPEAIDALAPYLPADVPGVILYADLALAREQLGLPADADALAFERCRRRDSVPFSDAEGPNGTVPLRDFRPGAWEAASTTTTAAEAQAVAACRLSSIEARNSCVV